MATTTHPDGHSGSLSSEKSAAVQNGKPLPRENPESVSDITIKNLYPDFSPAELAEAEATLERYLEATLRMYQRICDDSASYAQFRTLTGE